MNDATAARWRKEATARAAVWWTADRRRNLLGDKQLVVDPVDAAPLLRVLDLLNGDGSMPPPSVRKFMQVNHMVALLEPLLLDLVHAIPEVKLVDLGCGSSYLTLLLAWCFRHRWRHPARLLGLDRNAQVLAASRVRAETCGLADSLHFEQAWIGSIPDSAVSGMHAFVALHACDTATDEAVALAVKAQARVIAVAPCCQAQLARSWSTLDSHDSMTALFGSPHLRRELAATMTDAYRMLLMRACGYRVTAMEFVPSTHTPKNTLLRAVYSGLPSRESLEEYLALRTRFGDVAIHLEHLLAPVIAASHGATAAAPLRNPTPLSAVPVNG